MDSTTAAESAGNDGGAELSPRWGDGGRDLADTRLMGWAPVERKRWGAGKVALAVCPRYNGARCRHSTDTEA